MEDSHGMDGKEREDLQSLQDSAVTRQVQTNLREELHIH